MKSGWPVTGPGFSPSSWNSAAPGTPWAETCFIKRASLDLKAEILAHLESLDYLRDMEAGAKAEQLRAMAIACDAIMLYGRRYRDYALGWPKRKQIRPAPGTAADCRKLQRRFPTRAQDFWQALQMYWFVHIGVTTELNPWDAF